MAEMDCLIEVDKQAVHQVIQMDELRKDNYRCIFFYYY